MDLLRVVTAGSVDDGKSTLIGRLLMDTGSVADDHIEELRAASAAAGFDGLDYSLLTDGLRAEREQHITIDVAYRYFGTGRRAFVLADAPGHEQYTRNMVTAASNADLAVLLTDASRGLTEQSRRHLAVVAMMRVPKVVACVNKMDVVGFAEAPYLRIKQELADLGRGHDLPEFEVIPMSARCGDNVVSGSDRMPWYERGSLLELLERADPGTNSSARIRLPVQLVLREHRPGGVRRWYAGRLGGGELRVGDPVVVLPGDVHTTVLAIRDADGEVASAADRASVSVLLSDDVDLARGGMLAGDAAPPRAQNSLHAEVCWFGEEPLKVGAVYALRHTPHWVRAVVQEIGCRDDLGAGSTDMATERLVRNELGAIRCELSEPLFVDSYWENRATGSFILVDETSAETVGAGTIRDGG